MTTTTSKFQQRHYEAIAELLGRANDGQVLDAQTLKIVARFAEMFREDNKNFKIARFVSAVMAQTGQTQEVEA